MMKVRMIERERQQKGKTKYRGYRNAAAIGYRELTPKTSTDRTRTSNAYALKNSLHKVGTIIPIKTFLSTDWIRTLPIRYNSTASLHHSRNEWRILRSDDLYCVPGEIRTQPIIFSNLILSPWGGRIRTELSQQGSSQVPQSTTLPPLRSSN